MEEISDMLIFNLSLAYLITEKYFSTFFGHKISILTYLEVLSGIPGLRGDQI
jgi:hypothetical protein